MTLLQNVGNFFKKFFGIAIKVATVAEPFIDLLLPGISGLFNATLAEIVKVEQLAASAGAQSGTGAQKLAMVLLAITPSVEQYAESQGLPKPTTDQITAFINAGVAALNALEVTPVVKAAVAEGTLVVPATVETFQDDTKPEEDSVKIVEPTPVLPHLQNQ